MQDDLAELDRPALEATLAARGIEPYRARQIFGWIHRRGVADIAGCVADLQARGYRGWAVVEQDMLGDRDSEGRTPLEGMSAAREYLRGLGLG